MQERFLLGANRDGTEAVIPFWYKGRVQGLIRRKLRGEPKYRYPAAKDFPGGCRPLFVPSRLHGGAILVEGIVDALAGAALGKGAIAVGGTSIGREPMEELRRLPSPLYVFPDADEEGARATCEWARDLYPKALLCPAEYGEDRKDLADLFAVEGEAAGERLEELRGRGVDALDLALESAPEGSARERFRYAREHALPLLLRLEDEGERYAALDDVARKLKLKASQLRKALSGPTARTGEPLGEPEDPAPKPGTERHERAMELLKSPDLLDRAAGDMERLGHVGERNTKKLALICGLSARSGRPIQPSTHAKSSAGKNALLDATLSLFPEEMVVRRSGLSAKALFRTEADLKGAVLYLQEVAGSEDASYTIRVMQSDGRLEYEATEKMPDGSMRNVVHQTEGPTVIVQTTTENHLHPENETRVFPIYIDESEEQTSRIVGSILREVSGGSANPEEREEILQRWRDAIRLLEPGEMIIPYAERIEVPSSPIRIRRDARRLVDVIRVIAWLHQRDRDDQGRILATEDDFHTALELVSESLRRAWQTLTPAEETVLEAIRDLPEGLRKQGFRRRDLKVPGSSDRRVQEVLRSLTDTGYLDCDGRQGPRGYTYTVARDAQEIYLNISLRASRDGVESPANGGGFDARKDLARYRAARDGSGEEDPMRETRGSARNGHRAIEGVNLQAKRASARTGDEDKKGEIPGELWEERMENIERELAEER